MPNVPVVREPKARRRGSKRLLMLLVVFFITLFLILFFQSPISKIAEVRVYGNDLVIAEEVVETSLIQIGDPFFGVSAPRVQHRLKSINAIHSAQIKYKFPGVIEITIREYPRVAFQYNSEGKLEGLLSTGNTVSAEGVMVDKPLLSGWHKDDPVLEQLCNILAVIPKHLMADVSEIVPIPTKSYPDKIKMYTKSKFEVITAVSYLNTKMKYYPQLVRQLAAEGESSGVFELLEADFHSPFEIYYSKPNSDNLNTIEKETTQ